MSGKLKTAVAMLVLLSATSCKGDVSSEHTDPIDRRQAVRLATTTSTDNSGLLDVLLPPFEKRFGIAVEVISVGTGKALAYGRNGDVDVVLVHARAAEDRFVAEGAGVNRRDVMYNDFVLVGPPDDPAGAAGKADAPAALEAIAGAGAYFVSRGDESGTHMREKQLWQQAGVEPRGQWYLSVGQGMGATLGIADEKLAYCLIDRGTWLALGKTTGLKLLLQGGDILTNPYGIIPVNPALHPEVNHVGAMALVGWVTSQEGRKLIAEYEIDGVQLFHPAAAPAPAEAN